MPCPCAVVEELCTTAPSSLPAITVAPTLVLSIVVTAIEPRSVLVNREVYIEVIEAVVDEGWATVSADPEDEVLDKVELVLSEVESAGGVAVGAGPAVAEDATRSDEVEAEVEADDVVVCAGTVVDTSVDVSEESEDSGAGSGVDVVDVVIAVSVSSGVLLVVLEAGGGGGPQAAM
jgi:hypothetical protein